MTTFRAQVTRDGKYWLIYIPEIGKHTQARNLAEVTPIAQDLIALWLEIPTTSVAIHPEIELPDGVYHHLEWANKYRAEAAQAQTEAAKEYRAAAATLRDAGLTYRDIGQVLDISHQRAAQLLEDTAAVDVA